LKTFIQLSHWLLLGVCILLAACESSEQANVLAFEDAWVRPIPPGMKMTAGFGILSNPEARAIEITSFASPQFGDVSLHRTELRDGLSRMLEVPSLVIGAGAAVVLKPGGYHLMLMMPTGEIQPGQTVSLEFAAADGRKFSFEVPVERR